jgi:PAS domain S-box-containing protein
MGSESSSPPLLAACAQRRKKRVYVTVGNVPKVANGNPADDATETTVALLPELVADDQGRYIECNDRACSMLGYSRDELLALSVWDLTPEGNQVEGLVMWQEFLGTGFQAGSYWLVRKDEQVVEVAYRAVSDAVSGRHKTLLKAMPLSREPSGGPCGTMCRLA